VANDEERLALFVDFENLALGARDRGEVLDPSVIMDALSERGRVVVRRAYADWNLFSEHRMNLVGQRIEMIEVPQRTGMVRKNAADIKLAVDALELAFEREFITTFVIASGDSDFTPLVLKLRELNRRVIGVGVEGSTSELLPGACDEFLFYERLLGAGTGKEAVRRERPETKGSDLAALSRKVTTGSGRGGNCSGTWRRWDSSSYTRAIRRVTRSSTSRPRGGARRRLSSSSATPSRSWSDGRGRRPCRGSRTSCGDGGRTSPRRTSGTEVSCSS
jgi:uncharacterized protein (TIGR00288 family)